MAGKGTLTVRILGDDSHLNKTLGSVGGGLSKIGGLALKAGGLLGAAGLAGGFASAVSEAREAAKIGRLTEAVLKSTGGAANVSAAQVGAYAEKLSNLTGIDDEVIQGGENLLLTFTKVRNEVGEGNDIFNRATEAALNMSVALGTDMNGAALQMGKALNDPIKGMTALTRAGVSFTQQQKDQVKMMVAAGDTLGAQKLILAEMETQFGGAAAAAADPMQKLTTIAGNLAERLGTHLLPIIERAATWLGTALPTALGVVEQLFNIIFRRDFVGGPFAEDSPFIASVFNLRDTIVPIIAGAWEAIRTTVDAVVGFVSGIIDRFRTDHDNAATSIGGASTRIGVILANLKTMFASAFAAIRVVVDTVVKILTEAWDRFGRGLVDNLQRAIAAVLTMLGGAVQVLTGVFDLIKAVLTGKWGDAWEAIKKILTGALDILVGYLRLSFEYLRAIVETAMGVISGIWSFAWNAIKTFLADVWKGIVAAVQWSVGGIVGFFRDLPGNVLGALGDLGSLLFGKGVELVRGIIDGIGSAAGGIASAIADAIPGGGIVKGIIKKIPGFASGVTNFSGGLAVVGERGPELVRLPRGSDVIPNGGARSTAGRSSTLTVRGINPRDLFTGQQILDLLYEVQRTSGPLKLKIA